MGQLGSNVIAGCTSIANTLIIPEAAVIYDTQRHAFAEVVTPGAPKGRVKKAITLGVGNGTRTQVLGGLTQGQKVILQ